MTTESMNVHKALCELKMLSKRIASVGESITYVATLKHKEKKIGGKLLSQHCDDVAADFQSLKDLINRRNAIKSAVITSNALTTVTVDGQTMTVAEAIDYRDHVLTMYEDALYRMRMQYNDAQRTLEKWSGEALELKANNYVLQTLNSMSQSNKQAISDSARKSIRDDYIENNQYDLIDPIGIVSAMREFEDMIESLKSNIDGALSTSNALTIIQIEY